MENFEDCPRVLPRRFIGADSTHSVGKVTLDHVTSASVDTVLEVAPYVLHGWCCPAVIVGWEIEEEIDNTMCDTLSCLSVASSRYRS